MADSTLRFTESDVSPNLEYNLTSSRTSATLRKSESRSIGWSFCMVDRLCHILYVGMDLAIIFQSEEFSITVCINLQSDKLRRIANLARDLETELNLQAT